MIIEKKDRFQIWAHKLMAKAQAKLHVSPSAMVLLDWDIKDEYGNLIKRHTGKSHSFVRNYSNMNALNGIIGYAPIGTTYAAGSIALWLQTNSVATSVTNSFGHSTVAAPIGDAAAGIIVGTGSTAESFDQYRIDTLIAHGTGAGQLSYSVLTATAAWNSGPKTITNVVQRIFTNNTANTITINEICLVDVVYTTPGSSNPSPVSILLIRDVPTPIDVAAAANVTITYTFSYQFP